MAAQKGRARPAPKGEPLEELPLVEPGPPALPPPAPAVAHPLSGPASIRVLSHSPSWTAPDGSHFTLRAGESMVVPRQVADAMILHQLAEEV